MHWSNLVSHRIVFLRRGLGTLPTAPERARSTHQSRQATLTGGTANFFRITGLEGAVASVPEVAKKVFAVEGFIAATTAANGADVDNLSVFKQVEVEVHEACYDRSAME